MKFKFGGVEKYQAKSIFSIKFERTKDVEMRSRSLFSYESLTNQDPIILAKLSTLIILLKKRKISDNYEGSNSNKN